MSNSELFKVAGTVASVATDVVRDGLAGICSECGITIVAADRTMSRLCGPYDDDNSRVAPVHFECQMSNPDPGVIGKLVGDMMSRDLRAFLRKHTGRTILSERLPDVCSSTAQAPSGATQFVWIWRASIADVAVASVVPRTTKYVAECPCGIWAGDCDYHKSV